MADSTGHLSFDSGIRVAPDSNGHVYAFEEFELRTQACELFRAGRATGLHLKPTRLLLYLIENRERTVPKEELLQAIWPDTYISESAFTTTIGYIRHALDDDGDSQRLIRTFRGRGYRFVGSVVESTPEEAADVDQRLLESSQARRRVRLGFTVAGGLALSLLIFAVVSWYRATEALRDPVQDLAFGERDWVLISSFENKTGETVFDDTLEHALERTLVNSRFVNVVPRGRIQDTLRLMKQPLDARVDVSLGREICLRDGAIRALVAGQIEKLGTTYVLSVQIVDPAEGVKVASLSEQAQGEDQVWPAIRRLASGVRGALGEDLALIRLSESKLVKVTTPSLRALRLYSEADSVIAGGPANDRMAEQLLKQAIAEDPEFASAYTHLAFAVSNQGRSSDEYLPYAKKGLELADQLPDREHYFIQGSYFFLVGQDEDDDMLASYESLLRLYPDHFWATNNIRHALTRLGRYEEAASYIARRAQLRPTSFQSNFWAYESLSRLGNPKEGLAYLPRAVELAGAAEQENLPGQVARVQMHASYAHWLEGDLVAMQRELEQWAQALDSAKGAYRSELAAHLGRAYFLLGQTDKAGDHFGMVAKYQPISYSWRGTRTPPQWSQLYQSYEAFQHNEMARIPELASDWPSTARAIHLAGFGFVDLARESLAEAEATVNWPNTPGPPEGARRNLDLARAMVAYGEDRTDDTISLLKPLIQAEEDYRLLGYFASQVLASAWLRQGNMGEAVRVLERAGRDRLRAAEIDPRGWVRVRLRLVSLYRALGRTVESDQIEAEIRDLLAYADEDYWMVRYLDGETRWDPRFPGWLHRVHVASEAAR